MDTDDPRYDGLRAAGWSPVESTGFSATIGPFWTAGPERFSFLVEEKHLNRRRHVHGGMLLAFADRYLSSSAPRAPGVGSATIQLDMKFVAPGHIGDIVEIRSRTIRETRSLIFADGDLTVGDRIIASASGVWKKLGPRSTQSPLVEI